MANIGPDQGDHSIEVACAVLTGNDGDLLIAQRPAGKVAAGKWEFPGGKIETGESSSGALERELLEELGIRVEAATFLARLRQTYQNRTVWLDAWRVDSYSGQPVAREEQSLRWVPPGMILDYDVLPSCWRVLAALRLPKDYVFTPPERCLDDWLPLVDALPRSAFLRLRRPGLDDDHYYSEARRLLPVCRRNELALILDRDPAYVISLGASGWHADGKALQVMGRRPLPHDFWCLASTHDGAQIRKAWQADLDAAVLGPVQATSSHPGTPPMGWDTFSFMARQAGLPLFAIGGVGPNSHAARSLTATGLPRTAGITAYWSSGA